MKTVVKVSGMACSHCEQAVQKQVLAVAGVKSAHANAALGQVEIEYEGDVLDAVKTAIEAVGFDVE